MSASPNKGRLASDLAIARYRVATNPLTFTHQIFHADLWPMQKSILKSVATNSRTAVKACHASGKTMLAALAVIWWLARYRKGKVVTTAPTWEQVRVLIWGEIHRAIGHGLLTKLGRVNQTEIRVGPGSYALGLATNKGVRFQGFHGDHVLIVMDEAPGVMGDIWESIEGTRAGGNVHLLALGNPTTASGPFYDAFTANRDGWTTFSIDAFDTPNLQGMSLAKLRAMPRGLPEDSPEFGFHPRPYLITRRWVYEKFWEWGERSPLWQSRVCGQFPDQGEDALISFAWLENARKMGSLREAEPKKPNLPIGFQPATYTPPPRPADMPEPMSLPLPRPIAARSKRLYAGIDVAGPGEDETVVVLRNEKGVIVAIKSWRSADTRGDVVNFLNQFRSSLSEVHVDSIGIGYNFGLHLRDQGFNVELINVGQPSREPDKFANLKAEYYWSLRIRFEAGEVSGLTDEVAISQLAGIRYHHNSRGQVQIESKEEARKRGVKSPDRADAIMLAFANRTPAILEYYRRLSEEASEVSQSEPGGPVRRRHQLAPRPSGRSCSPPVAYRQGSALID